MAFTYMPPLSQYLTSAIPDLPAWIAPPIGFILIFFLIVLLFRWLSVILAKVLTWSLLGWLNRFGGAFFGLFKGLLVASLLAILLSMSAPSFPVIARAIESSRVYPWVVDVAPLTYSALSTIFPHSEETIRKFEELLPEVDIPEIPELDQLPEEINNHDVLPDSI
jgi:uncharacterized membrane protein required for colicin V production